LSKNHPKNRLIKNISLFLLPNGLDAVLLPIFCSDASMTPQAIQFIASMNQDN
jgi:hypothetical protein